MSCENLQKNTLIVSSGYLLFLLPSNENAFKPTKKGKQLRKITKASAPKVGVSLEPPTCGPLPTPTVQVDDARVPLLARPPPPWHPDPLLPTSLKSHSSSRWHSPCKGISTSRINNQSEFLKGFGRWQIVP